MLWRTGPEGPQVALVPRRSGHGWRLPAARVPEGGPAPLAALAAARAAGAGGGLLLGSRPAPGGWSVRTREPSGTLAGPRWATPQEALGTVRDEDRALLGAWCADPRPTTALVVVRHAHARARSRWHGDDLDRPLSRKGRAQAAGASLLLSAWGVEQVVTSPAERCTATVAPYAGAAAGHDDRLTETDPGRSAALVPAAVAQVRAGGALALCTHRKTLPALLDALEAGLGVPGGTLPGRVLAKGGLLVLHVPPEGGPLGAEVHGPLRP